MHVKESKWQRGVIFIGVMICAIGVFWASIEQSKSERKIVEKSEEIARLNEKITGSITGGNSFAYVLFLSINMELNSSLLSVVQKGDYPLYDISIRIVDVDKFSLFKNQEGPLDYNKISKAEKVLNIGNLGSGHSTILAPWKFPNKNSVNYNIFIGARNGLITELVRMKRVNGVWKTAYKVIRQIFEKDMKVEVETLLEKIDPDFPTNIHGEVDW